jgi:hypothetical protein
LAWRGKGVLILAIGGLFGLFRREEHEGHEGDDAEGGGGWTGKRDAGRVRDLKRAPSMDLSPLSDLEVKMTDHEASMIGDG